MAAHDPNRRPCANAGSWPWLGVAAAALLMVAAGVRAQTLDSLLDEDQFLRGLCQLGAAEVLEQYIAAHPASDAARQAQFEIARQRIRLADQSMSPDHRLAAIDRMLAIRSDLLAQRPNDDRRSLWLADQAADLYFELLPIDAAGWTTILGVPSEAQRDRAARAAREMHAAASQAEDQAARAASPSAPGGRASQQRRNRQLEQERQRRIPFLRGVGACLQAEFNIADASQRKSMYALAAELLPPLTQTLEGVVAIDARLFAALAQMRLGLSDEADANLAAVITNQSAMPMQVFCARMLSVMNRASAAGLKAGLDSLNALDTQYRGADNVFFTLLIADQRFRLRKAAALAAPADERPALVAAAYSTYTNLLSTDLGVPRDTVQAAVFARLADSVDRSAPIESLPAIVAIARADQMSRSNSRDSQMQAVAMLDAALARGSLDPFERSTASFARARALYSLEQRDEAARTFLQLAQQADGGSVAPRAAELAASLTAELLRERPADQSLRTQFDQALTVLLTRYPSLPTIDRWRLAAAQFADEDGRFDDAINALSAIPAASAQYPEAQYFKARAAAHGAARIGDAAQSRAANEHALSVIDLAQTAIEAASTQPEIDSDRRQTLKIMLDRLGPLRAETLLTLHQPDKALESLKNIEAGPAVDRLALAEALRIRIAAYQAMQQPEKAATEINEYFNTAPDQAYGVIIPMLELLQTKVQALIDSGQDEQAADLARTTLQSVAAMVKPRLVLTPPPAELRAAVMLRIAEAYRLSGEYAQALAFYELQLAAQPDLTTLILGRAECLYHLGGEERLAEAMNAYKRLSAAGVSAGIGAYWLSQLRMLQVLDAINRNTNQIMPRIERLRQQDPNFGGEQFRRGFDALRQKYTGK